jgi:hypothetical protein
MTNKKLIPLTYDKLYELSSQFQGTDYAFNGQDEIEYNTFDWNGFAREIEKAHGIE